MQEAGKVLNTGEKARVKGRLIWGAILCAFFGGVIIGHDMGSGSAYEKARTAVTAQIRNELRERLASADDTVYFPDLGVALTPVSGRDLIKITFTDDETVKPCDTALRYSSH